MTIETLAAEVLEAAWRLPPVVADTRVIVRAGWRQMITPSLPQGGCNEVSHCVVDEASIERALDETIAEYRGIRFRFIVGPGTKPEDLAERLARRGFSRVDVHGMARDLSPIEGVPAGVRVEAAIDESGADLFTDVTARGWEMDPAPLRPMHRAMLTRSYRLFVARIAGEPVGVGAYALAGTTAYQMGAVVLPAFRRRGVYRALVAARLADAACRGATLATSQARAETSAPLLAKLGFDVVCRFPMMTSPRSE